MATASNSNHPPRGWKFIQLDQINELRKAQNLSIEQLAEQAKCNKDTIQKWLVGGFGDFYFGSNILKALGINDVYTYMSHRNWVPTLPTPPSSLRPPTLFLERKTECKKLNKLLQDPQVRLVIVVGIGGMGKTSLIQQVASQQKVEMFPQGIFWVPLRSALTYKDVLRSLVRSVFGVDEMRPVLEMLIERLKGTKRALLVLDNLEQFLQNTKEGEALCGALEELLAHCPNLTILGTSRQELLMKLERVFRLNSMTPPDALKVFHYHFQKADPVVDWDEEIAQTICSRLEGWPALLAIAASHVRWRTLTQILNFLPELPADETWNQAERFHSAEALLDDCCIWLKPEQRECFFALAILGSFDEVAAQAVAGVDKELLKTLLKQNLLLAQEDILRKIMVYRLLEPVRQFALRQLEALPGPQQQALWERHGVWCCTVGESELAQVKQTGSVVAEWVLQETEEDRCVALKRSRGAIRDRLLTIQGRVAARRGKLTEAQLLLEEATKSAEQYAGWAELSYVAREQGKREIAQFALEKAEGLIKNDEERVDALALRAHLYIVSRDFDRAYQHLQASKQLAQELGLEREVAKRCAELGWWAQESKDPQRCRQVLDDVEQGVTLYQELSDRRGEANITNTLGALLFELGRLEEAQGHYFAALDLLPTNANVLVRGRVLFNLGEVASKIEPIKTAMDFLEQAKKCFKQCGAYQYEEAVSEYIRTLQAPEDTVQ